MTTRNQQKEKRREDILNKSLDIFIRNGYAAVKIEDISKAVGMSNGLLFHYFESKEKLYEELIKIGVSGNRTILTIDTSDPYGFFDKAAKFIFESLEPQNFIAKMFLLMYQATVSDSTPTAVKALISEFDFIEFSAQLIIKGQEQGTIRKGNPEALAIAFWNSISGIAQYIGLNPKASIPEYHWIMDIIKQP